MINIILGNAHLYMLTAIDNLTGVLNKQGKFAEAETVIYQALEL